MRPTPPGWPRIASALYYRDPGRAIDWLVKAFGFTVRVRIDSEDGTVHHSELEFGEGLIMVGTEGARSGRPDRAWCHSPKSVDGANTQSMMVYVDDVDRHCAKARSAGATIVEEPRNTDYGAAYWEDRGYECIDPEGHHWWFLQRIRNPEG